MKKLIFASLIFCFMNTNAQVSDSTNNYYVNSVEKMINNKPGLGIGGYGEVHYNQPMNNNQFDFGTLDVHRLVMFMGYNFSRKTQFVTEIEFEYAKELAIEQMFIQHKLNNFLNFRAGLVLVPMGIINEYHEPTTFNGVERPIIDNKITPTTWREIGMGFSGNNVQSSLKYQIYVVNGFNGYDQSAGLFSGSKGLREGRQKGSKAYISSPNLTTRLEYYGLKNLNLGISGYFGRSGSKLYANLNKDSVRLVQKADSSVVGISMVGFDARYHKKGLKLIGQLYYSALSNTKQYNAFTQTLGKNNDLGSSMLGYYIEVGYDILNNLKKTEMKLIPFVRYELYNTHQTVDEITIKNPKYLNTVITSGITYAITKGAVLKTDMQLAKSKIDDKYSKTINVGFGVMF